MSDTIFESHNIKLKKMMEDIRIGEIGLPDLQRPFVWPNEKIKALYDSLLKGFPIGYVMLWKSPEEYKDKVSGIGKTTKEFKMPENLIIDGQQRLTALVATMYGIPVKDKSFKNRRIKICYNPLQDFDRFENWSAAREQNPEWFSDISEIFIAHEQDYSITKVTKAYVTRLNESYERTHQPTLTEEQVDRINDRFKELLDLGKYDVPMLHIYSRANESEVAEIFVRVNAGGQKLNENDFILTLLSVYANEDRTRIDDFCAESHIPAPNTSYNNLLTVEPVHLIRMVVGVGFRRARLRYAYMLLRGKDLESGIVTSSLRQQNLELFNAALNRVTDLNNWHAFLNILSQCGYNSSKLIAAQNAIVFSYVLYLIAKYDFGLSGMALMSLFRRWFFMAAITSYFSSSVETDVEKMFADMKGLKTGENFEQYLNSIIEARLTDDYFNITLPKELESSAAISPHWYAYLAAQNILNIPMLFSTDHLSHHLLPGSSGTKNSVDKHHIFPKQYLASIGIDADRQRNQIANYTYLDYQTNIDISDRCPVEYVDAYRQKFGEKNFAQMCADHALPDAFEKLEYFEFLAKRRRQMSQVIRRAYEHLRKI